MESWWPPLVEKPWPQPQPRSQPEEGSFSVFGNVTYVVALYNALYDRGEDETPREGEREERREGGTSFLSHSRKKKKKKNYGILAMYDQIKQLPKKNTKILL